MKTKAKIGPWERLRRKSERQRIDETINRILESDKLRPKFVKMMEDKFGMPKDSAFDELFG